MSDSFSGPHPLFADIHGNVAEIGDLRAAGRYGDSIAPLPASELIPLPPGSRLHFLPARRPLAFTGRRQLRRVPWQQGMAVAAFLPPGYVALATAAYESRPDAPLLPLFSYAAACWYRGALHVPALRIDDDPKHDPGQFDPARLTRRVARALTQSPGNRLLAHHGRVCALEYGCPNAANLFLRRWEAPVAVSGACNAACKGCISRQGLTGIRSPQDRVGFTPTLAEIVDLAVPHLEKAPRAMISFGQGCEGEPLMKTSLIVDAIRVIRRHTLRGTIHLNTNGSLPRHLERLIDSGLDSVRISMNSAQPALYTAYYRPRGYSLADVRESFLLARSAGLWVSVNFLTFPGVSDRSDERAALQDWVEEARPNMIQWRNLNIDPEGYLRTVRESIGPAPGEPLGLRALITHLSARFPALRMGYLNPAVRRRSTAGS